MYTDEKDKRIFLRAKEFLRALGLQFSDTGFLRSVYRMSYSTGIVWVEELKGEGEWQTVGIIDEDGSVKNREDNWRVTGWLVKWDEDEKGFKVYHSSEVGVSPYYSVGIKIDPKTGQIYVSDWGWTMAPFRIDIRTGVIQQKLGRTDCWHPTTYEYPTVTPFPTPKPSSTRKYGQHPRYF